MSDILSFQTGSNEPKSSIWDNLRSEVEKQVKSDGLNPKKLAPDDIDFVVMANAVDEINARVAEFYYWWFNADDQRRIFIKTQKPSAIPNSLRSAVAAVVKDNLEAMREADEIPTGQDVPNLEERITNALARYIVNWEDWYYDFKAEDDEEYYSDQAYWYEQIYLDSNYGKLGNLLGNDTFDIDFEV